MKLLPQFCVKFEIIKLLNPNIFQKIKKWLMSCQITRRSNLPKIISLYLHNQREYIDKLPSPFLIRLSKMLLHSICLSVLCCKMETVCMRSIFVDKFWWISLWHLTSLIINYLFLNFTHVASEKTPLHKDIKLIK